MKTVMRWAFFFFVLPAIFCAFKGNNIARGSDYRIRSAESAHAYHGSRGSALLSYRQMQQAIRRVMLQFVLLGMIEVRSHIGRGITLPVNAVDENLVLESDNIDDDDEDIIYNIKAVFTEIGIQNLVIAGKRFPVTGKSGIPTWHLTLTADTIAARADVQASADLGDMEDDWWIPGDLLPDSASTRGEAFLTVEGPAVPVDVTIAEDEDGRPVARYTIIPADREDELDEGSKDFEVDLDELSAYDHHISDEVLDLMEPLVEDWLYDELDIENLLSEAAEEVLDAPLGFL